MRTGCRGCLRRWCWSWSATLSSQLSTPWLRAMPRGCSSRGTLRRKPSDDETKRYKHPSDCVSAAAESPPLSPSHSQLNKSNPHSFSKRLNPQKKDTVCWCVCFQGCMCCLSLFRFFFFFFFKFLLSSHSVCSVIGSTADLNMLL